MFVDNNAHKLQEWLEAVAEGVVRRDADGNIVEVITQPNPEKAFQLFQSVVEYHIPKLQRTENTTKMSVSIEDALKQIDL